MGENSGLASQSCMSAPTVWAKLTRLDPSKQGHLDNDEEKHSISDSNFSKSHPEGAIVRNDGVYWYNVKSDDFPNGDTFYINSDVFSIGRAKSCHLQIQYNKLISGNHCSISRHESDKKFAWLEDTSSNGTLINQMLKVSKRKALICNGDVFHLVFKNNDTTENIGFKLHIMESAESPTLECLDQTLEAEFDIPQEQPESSKRCRSPSTDDSSIAKKKLRPEQPEASDVCDEDEIGETLLCIICQDIFHDCVSLQPCMHSFCAGCYSEWMATSNECPCCRLTVERINKNHLVNKLVESYLKTHPDKARSESDINELDGKNKITHDMLYKRQNICSSSGTDSDSRSGSDSSSNSPSIPSVINYNPALAGTLPTFGPPRTHCRQCPRSAYLAALFSEDTSSDDSAPTCSASDDSAAKNVLPDVKSTPQAPDYVCVPNQNHVLCMCCLQPMPDRRQDRQRDPTIPQQRCDICYRVFCHAYWTCRKADCLGCLGKFREMNFGRKCLSSIILENQFESDVLRDYLDAKGLSVREMLNSCVVKMEAGEYSTSDRDRRALTADTVVCYPCGIRNFRELAYLYRRDIDNADLPDAVTRRANCYWGKGCRTQKHKPAHAAKLNHICEASRTA